MLLSPQGMIKTGAFAAAAATVLLGGYNYASMWPSSQLFGATLIAPRRPGEIALTFDDGPNPLWTPRLLETLAKHNVRATFFMMGMYAANQRTLVREMHDAGHLIGDHTWSHPNLARTSAQKTREELTRTKSELEQIIAAPVRYFRPPFGARKPITLQIARELGMIPVTWNAMTSDWSATKAEQVTPRIAKYIATNEERGFATNIVLHDGSHDTPVADRSASVGAAGQLLEIFGRDHQFVRLDAWTE